MPVKSDGKSQSHNVSLYPSKKRSISFIESKQDQIKRKSGDQHEKTLKSWFSASSLNENAKHGKIEYSLQFCTPT